MVNQKTLLVAAFAAIIGTAGIASAQKICIDPGHGGTDPGASSNSVVEKFVVLDTGLKFRTWMNADTNDSSGGGSWNVIMTRTTDTTVSLSGRTGYANNNNANRFMSIHHNAHSTTSANGIETFCYGSGSSSSYDLRDKVYAEAVAMWPLTKRGTKTANFYVLVNTNMPAELHEMAFVTNSTDRSYLGSASHRDNHALSELYAIQRHYGKAKFKPGTTTTVTVDNSNSGFSASSNWGTSSNVAGYYGSNYRVRATASVSDAASWVGNLPSSGTYTVSAWWTSASDRSASAPYIVHHSNGSSTVNVNQRANGGKWNSLGSYSFGSGNRQVQLSCWTSSGNYVIADAIRWRK